MNLKNKIIFLLVFMIAILVPIFSEEAYPKPRKDEVVLVFGCHITPKINKDFFKKYIGKSSKNLKFSDKEPGNFKALFVGNAYKYETSVIKDEDSMVLHGSVSGKGNSDFVQKLEGHVDVSDTISTICYVPADRKIRINYLEYLIGSSNVLNFDLPVFVEFQVPKNVNYIYLGDFYYRTSGDFFEIASYEIKDNMDTATRIVKERYSDSADLVKAVLKPFK